MRNRRGVAYADRAEAGAVLARLIVAPAGGEDVVVLALPRGGVPVAAPIATALGAELDVLVVRKLGLPRQPELAMGAVAGIGGRVEVVRNEGVLESAHVDPDQFDAVLRRETEELRRREFRYRGDRPGVELRGRVVVLVDDGLATGATMRSAIAAVANHRPSAIKVAVPIGSPRTCAELAAEVDELICPWMPARFSSVGQGYRDFDATEDAEVIALLESAATPAGQPPRRQARRPR